MTQRYVTKASTIKGMKTLICGFCNIVFRGGGINYIKQYLAEARGNVISCKKVIPDIRFPLQGSLKENNKKQQKFEWL